MLSNMVNAGVSDVGLIVHANYQSLLDHVGSGKDWDLSRKHGGLRILPPFGYSGRREGVYRGRMDALAGVRSYLQYIRQDYVVLAGGDLAVNLPLNDIFEPISAMTRTLPPCAPAAPWARPRTATTSPSAPEGGSPTYWCTPHCPGLRIPGGLHSLQAAPALPGGPLCGPQYSLLQHRRAPGHGRPAQDLPIRL